MTAELKKEEKKGLLITGDVSAIIKQIGKEKNETVKSRKQMEMTEDDINKLFGESPRMKPDNNLLRDRMNIKI